MPSSCRPPPTRVAGERNRKDKKVLSHLLYLLDLLLQPPLLENLIAIISASLYNTPSSEGGSLRMFPSNFAKANPFGWTFAWSLVIALLASLAGAALGGFGYGLQ